LPLTAVVLAVDAAHAGARAVAIDATAALLESTGNFWESAWLRRSITKLGGS
jgi:hypothetical protein